MARKKGGKGAASSANAAFRGSTKGAIAPKAGNSATMKGKGKKGLKPFRNPKPAH